MKPWLANFRFYAELNDFLPAATRGQAIPHRFRGHPAVKDPIEALGVPHGEVDLVLANGHSVGFDYRLEDGDRIAVYPVFESLDLTGVQHLRPRPLRVTRFVVDVNLGKLARRLRLLGFDTRYGNRLADREIVDIARREARIILTRDRRLLFRREVTHGYWVRAERPHAQLREVARRLDLGSQARPFTRCIDCNGLLEAVAREQVEDRLEPLTRRYYDEFFECRDCRKVYWPGSHLDGMRSSIAEYL